MNGLPWPRPPRAWQAEAAEAWLTTRDDHPRQLVHAVMGAGKSLLIDVLAQEAQSALVVVPRLMLVDQMIATIPGAVEWSGRASSTGRIVVACDDSLSSYPPTRPDLLVVDEAHRSETGATLDAIERIAPRRVLGFSATPYRARRSEELSAFDVLCYSYTAADALRDGVCVPPVVESAAKEGQSVDEAVTDWLRGAPKPAIVNARSIADAETYAAQLERDGIAAQAVHSRLSSQEAWRRVRAAVELEQTIVHVSMLTEGVDVPELRSLVLRRASASPVAFCQYVGRGMRAHAGKTCLRVFDPLDQWGAFDLSAEAVLAGQAETTAAPTVDCYSSDGLRYTAEQPILAGIGPGITVAVYPSRRPGQRVKTTCIDVRRDGFTVDTPGPIGACTARVVEWRTVDAARRAAVEPRAVALSTVEAWLKAEAATIYARGAVPCRTRSKGWRKDAASRKQQAFVDRLLRGAARHAADLRPILRTAIGRALDVRAELSKGAASDLATVLLATCAGRLDSTLDSDSITF